MTHNINVVNINKKKESIPLTRNAPDTHTHINDVHYVISKDNSSLKVLLAAVLSVGFDFVNFHIAVGFPYFFPCRPHMFKSVGDFLVMCGNG